MEYIGFTEKYYTLWDVTNDGMWTHYRYVQNLSMDFDKAKAKRPNACVDLSLRGHSSFKVKSVPTDCFQYGKYRGEFYKDCTDIDYLAWYHNNSTDDAIKRKVAPILVEQGYRLWDGTEMVTEEGYKRKEFLHANFPKFQAKVNNCEGFRFVPQRNLRCENDEFGDLMGVMEIPYCKMVFPSVAMQTYKECVYYLPTINGTPIRIKGNIVCVDEYDATPIGKETYRIEVKKFHMEYTH